MQAPVDTRPAVDPTERVDLLMRDLRARPDGLSGAEAQRRLVAYGRNELSRRGGRRWPRQLAQQFTHPLALLLWAAAALAAGAGIHALAVAIVAVIVVNAVFAFVQEQQAERAVEALQELLPPHATVLRDGGRRSIAAAELVRGDVLLIDEGDRISADARLIEGALEVDTSALTGESVPVYRTADRVDVDAALLDAPELVFSGTSCTGGEARALVFATGMQTELGRVAAMSELADVEESPLQAQVKRVAWLIAAIAVGVGLAFLPLGTIVAGLSLHDAAVFAIGLLVANVPEGLLPTITLALAVGVRQLARRRAVVKRLSAVETLGSADVICTDKTGTLTQNRMRVTIVRTAGNELELERTSDEDARAAAHDDEALAALARAGVSCNNAELGSDGGSGDPTELAILRASSVLGANPDAAARASSRVRQFHFDPGLKRMSVVDKTSSGLRVSAKGAPDTLLPLCWGQLWPDGSGRPLSDDDRAALDGRIDAYARAGLRVLAVAGAELPGSEAPDDRVEAETRLCLLGLVAMLDPPREEVADAVARCHTAGIRIIVVTGDHGLTAASVARRVGISVGEPTVVSGPELDAMSEARLHELLDETRDLIFARSSPEAKVRIADALRHQGHVVAMTGDGVNDAPALRRADIGVAMGLSGTDVAREAATLVLTDDNFATIVAAVEEGRRVYGNIRKFILYIFAHAPPEVVPFLLFALSGGAIPLPLSALQILAIDLGTETLPALALGREPAEPGTMERPPRRRSEGVVNRALLVRAWAFLGLISALLVMVGFLYVLLQAGWSPGDDVGDGDPLHGAYLEATTATFLGIVSCQLGTAFAARTELASLRSVGPLSNRLLLWGIAFELVFAAAVVYLPPLQEVFDTRALGADVLLLVAPFGPIVWAADELRRRRLRSVLATETGAEKARMERSATGHTVNP